MASGEEIAWPSLRAELLSYLSRRTSDAALAEDLVQDVLLRIHEQLPTLRDDRRLAPWIYRVAKNRLIDHYRAPQRDSVGADDLASADEGNESNASNQLVGAWLMHMIDSLPDTYREAVRLAELEGLQQKEIAERLGLSLSGAKSRVQRGRARLRQDLDRCCAVEIDRRGNVIDVVPRSPCC